MEKIKTVMRTWINILSYSTLLLLASCKAGFEKIEYGKEACGHCKMTIVDPQFAAEMVTEKGKVYKFDDVLCMKQFATDYETISKNAHFYVAGYTSDQEEFLDATKTFFLRSDLFRSPMSGNFAAFATREQSKHWADSLMVEPITWNNIK
jgi:copper chaperone NosL